MVLKNDLLKYVSEQAEMEANRRSLDEYATKNLIAEATEIINDLFMSITVEKVEGYVIKSIDPVTNWRHREADDRESDWQKIHFKRADLQNAAERYLGRPWLHCRELDWFIVNALMYAQYQATLDFVLLHNRPFTRYLSKKTGVLKWRVSSAVWRSIVLIAKWLLWLGIFALTFRFVPVGPVAWTALTVLWSWQKWKALKKTHDLMASMIATYETLRTVSPNWQVVWNTLKKSRDAGVVWDGIVDRLVEERMHT